MKEGDRETEGERMREITRDGEVERERGEIYIYIYIDLYRKMDSRDRERERESEALPISGRWLGGRLGR